MKRPIYILVMMGLAVGLSACAPKKKSESIRSARCARGGCEEPGVNNNANGGNTNTGTNNGSGQNTGVSTGTLWGQIHRQTTLSGMQTLSQAAFYYNVEGLVSANIDSFSSPSELGYVSGDKNQNTGIWFWGDVKLQNGAFNPSGNGQSPQIQLNGAELRVVVWDDYAGKTDAAGAVIPEYPIHIRGASSASIQGNEVRIRFEDSYGWVELVGVYDQQYFKGYVHYSNSTFWDGKTRQGNNGQSIRGASGGLGFFDVPTCGFFRCQ